MTTTATSTTRHPNSRTRRSSPSAIVRTRSNGLSRTRERHRTRVAAVQSAPMTDDQLKTAIGGGLVAWIGLSLAGVAPAVGGIGFVVSVVAAIVLFMRRRGGQRPRS